MSEDEAGREPPSLTELDYGAAELRADAPSVDAMLHAFVERLSAIPGLAMKVVYRHARWRWIIGDIPFLNDLHRRADPVQDIAVTLGTTEYWLRATGGTIRCGTDSIVPGRGRTTGEMSFTRWAEAMFQALTEKTKVHQDSIAGLRDLIENNRL